MISYVAPKPHTGGGGSKTQNGRFLCKIALRLKKACYRVSLCENCQRRSCKAFIGLTIPAQTIGGGDPFYVKFWVKLICVGAKSPIFDPCIFARSASAVTPSEKSSINAKRKSTTRFSMHPR